MMPVKRYKTVSRFLLCGLLPVFNVQADEMPSMDFLEYLGGVENEIDGKLSSPVELDLEAAVVASHSDKQKIDEVRVDSEASDEKDSNE